MDASFLTDRIARLKVTIVLYEDAVDALATDGIQSYILDTGQNRQNVTRLDVADLNNVLESLYNRCATMEARLNGSGVLTVRPCW
jgi:hypothetical protein